MASVVDAPIRVSLDGKFFRLGVEKFFPKGVAYGPFAPNANGEPFADPEPTRRDLALIRDLGANVVRVYDVPPVWLLDLALAFGLRVFIDLSWPKDTCFLDDPSSRESIRNTVRRAAGSCAHHSAVFAISVVNEIPADIVRWSGSDAVAGFIDELVHEVKRIEPECLCTFGNFPTTEFLQPQTIDFLCFNVYLHAARSFQSYIARLQMIADAKPLLLGELGADSLRMGEAAQASLLAEQIELVFRGGAAGIIVYSFTDDWHRGGRAITDWAFGLTTRTREPKSAFAAVQTQFAIAPYYPLDQTPHVSVVVAAFNASKTIETCLASLERLRYSHYEIIVVDDGSTDDTWMLVARHTRARLIRHSRNLGLSVARNTGIAAAQGSIVAFTDADCRADEDWLYYLVGDLIGSDFVGIGGPNLLPPDDSCVAAAVMVSPGGPAHVMFTDRVAEHIPGCNMAFYRWVLDGIGGFDPLFRQAGDDVDVCWRLQQAGHRIGFSPAGFVWHYRRSTVRAYLEQQRGYGEAEAMLVRKHPEYFNAVGGSVWQGRIYSSSKFATLGRRAMIYHGSFGSSLFQSIYTSPDQSLLLLFTSLEFYALVVAPLGVVACVVPFVRALALVCLLLPFGLCILSAVQARLPKHKSRWWSRPLIALLFWLQPLARGWARYRGRLDAQPGGLSERESLESLSLEPTVSASEPMSYWSEAGVSRMDFLKATFLSLAKSGWDTKLDAGWNPFDLEILSGRWTKVQLITVSETHRDGKTLIRCRLRSGWTLWASAAFWGSAAMAIVLAASLGLERWWAWLGLLALPIWWFWITRERHAAVRILATTLDEIAKGLNLVKLTPRAESSSIPLSTGPAPRPVQVRIVNRNVDSNVAAERE